MFTKQQLRFLISAQSGDDWHPSYFLTVLKDCKEKINEDERKAVLQYVESLNSEQIWNLQMALNHLNLLPDFHQ